MSGVQEKSGSFWLLTLLIAVTLLLLVALTWQAIHTARSNVRIVESVLTDYAGTATERFVRYVTQYFGMWWSFQFGRELRAYFEAPDYDPDQPFRLSAHAPPTLLAALEACEAIFRIDWSGESVRALEGELPVPAERLMSLARTDSDGHSFFVRHLDTGGSSWWLTVFYPLEGRDHWYGVIYDPQQINERLRRLAVNDQLLPRAVVGGISDNEGIYVSLRSPSGDLLFNTGREPEVDWEANYFPVRHRIEGDYRGLFSDFIVTVAIDPDLAETLIIGGLPRTRLPLLATLLSLTIVVLVAMFWVLLKERSLARMRNEFVARVSHEFRTPLTQIRLFAEMLLLDRTPEQDRSHHLGIINREAKRLSHLVANVLALSGRERRSRAVDVRPTDICALLEEIVDEYRSMLLRSTMRLVLRGCDERRDEPIFALVDAEAFTQVIINLLDNACKYGPAEQTVRIFFACDAHNCRIRVDDEGPGIPDDEKEHVWQLYYRVARDETRAVGGTGIGLPIARELVESMGGHCRVEDAPSGGARFAVVLKRAYP
jgi:signal transduction histidine kinase